MKTKLATLVTGLGGLCVLCCTLPIFGAIGLGSLEAFFCDTPWVKDVGVTLMTAGIGAFSYQLYKKSFASSCSTSCACKTVA